MQASKATTRRGREVPRPFKFHWGSGQIVEEASFVGRYVEPAIQLLEYEDHPGAYGIRFCYYSLDGRFQRSPMMLDGADSLDGMREALKDTPRLRQFLKKLVS
ncbi:MAG: hypothetical protein JOZ81_24790 [Chloroflexi bacterium]|nr:hypothetical protein [Chloroflexota bacterium]